jgi:hypothetical protein
MHKKRKEKEDITTDSAEIQRIIKECSANIYYNKLDDLDTFLDTYDYQN